MESVNQEKKKIKNLIKRKIGIKIFLIFLFINLLLTIFNLFTGALSYELESFILIIEKIMQYIFIPALILSIYISFEKILNSEENRINKFKIFLGTVIIFPLFIIVLSGYGLFPFINFIGKNDIIWINGRVLEMRNNERNNIREIEVLNETDNFEYIFSVSRVEYLKLSKNSIVGVKLKKGSLGLLYDKKIVINKIEEYYQKKNSKKVLEEANRILQNNSTDYYSLFYRVKVNIEMGNKKEAIKDIDILKKNYLNYKSKIRIMELQNLMEK